MHIPANNLNPMNLLRIIPALTQEEKNVLNDILPKIATKKSDNENEYIKNDLNFIVKVILPPFVWLHQRWPQGYKLLMNNYLEIYISKYADELLLASDDGDSKDRCSAVCWSLYPDQSAIYVNNFDKYSHSCLKFAIYHEIMHAIDNFIAKDKNKVTYASECLLKKYEKIMKEKIKSYKTNLNKAYNEIEQKFEEGTLEFEDFKKIMNKNGCWAYKDMPLEKFVSVKDMFSLFTSVIDDAQELIAHALTLFYGTDEENKRLQDMDSWLYDRIRIDIKNMMSEKAA